jgi:hypothetical protein
MMNADDFARLVAELAFPIVSGAGLQDAPETEMAMREQASILIASASVPTPDTEVRRFEGMGIGFELLTSIDMLHLVIEALLGACLTLGLTGTYEALRNWRSRRLVQIPDLEVVVSRPTAIHSELRQRLRALGLEDDQALWLADVAVQALAGKSALPPLQNSQEPDDKPPPV